MKRMQKKRKTYWNVFWQKFFWITLVLAGLAFLGMSIFVTITKDNFRNEFYEAENTRRNGIQEYEVEERDDFAEVQQFRGAAQAEAYQMVSILYDWETKEQIAGCEEQLVIIRSKTEETPGTMYCYPTEDIPGWSEHREKVQALKKDWNLIYESVEMPCYYQKGEEVVPGPFTVTVEVTDLFDFEITDADYEPELAFVSRFEAPKEITEEYEKKQTATETMKLAPLIVGYSKSNPWIYRLYKGADEAYELLQGYYEKVKAFRDELIHMEEETYFKLKIVSEVSEELKDGRKVGLLAVACYDVWETWEGIFLIIALGLLIFDMILALILSKITYAGLKARYATEDYRKNLMNTMAHDLKSPLMSVSGYAENLENNMNPGKQEHYAKEIQSNVQYMNRMIESILALSKVERDDVCLNKEKVDVPALFAEVQMRYEQSMKERDLNMTVEGQLTLQADKGLMLQVLDNLLGNAVKYATQGSVVRVAFGDKHLKMTNACETDLSDIVNKLCEPFVVGSESRSGKTGSGMGLAIVKNICELHGYRLKVGYENGEFFVCIVF